MGQESTKKCPFCGEVILAEAIKCRFCKEFLVDEKGVPVSYHDRRIQPPTQDTAKHDPSTALGMTAEPDKRQDVSSYRPVSRVNAGERIKPDTILYTGSPSLLGLAGKLAVTALLLFILAVVFFYPVGDLGRKASPSITENAGQLIDRIKGLGCIIVSLVIAARAAFKVLALKRIRYEVTPERIEFARGIFNRQIDNVDMFRVVDIKLHRSLADCLLGIGAVTLVTRDESDPVFEFEKIKNPKDLYDVLKKSSLQADRRQGVIHVD